MKKGKVVTKMTNTIPWNFTYTDSIMLGQGTMRWENPPVPKEHRIVISLAEEQFEYPSLKELRTQFLSTGLYSTEKVDEIIRAYERLPKYKAERRSSPRG